MNKRVSLSALTALLGLVGVAILLLWLGGAAPARAGIYITDRYVAPGGDDSRDCTDPTAPCRTIQRALDVGGTEETIHVAGGTYTSASGTVAAVSKQVRIRGGYSADFAQFDPELSPTVLDAQWAGSVVSVTSEGPVHLEHLTLTHGNGDGNCIQMGGCGGGIYARDTQLHVNHCVITGNVGSTSASALGAGGGIFVDNSAVSAPAFILENRIISNSASTGSWGAGGGLYLWGGSYLQPAVVARNSFEGNVGAAVTPTLVMGLGGAAHVSGYVLLDHNLFRGNRALQGGGEGYGGGLCLWEVWGADLEGNRFLENTAASAGSGYGGAIWASARATFTMTNNLLAQNHAGTAGGGLYLDTWDGSYLIQGSLYHNTLVDNDAGAGGEGIWAGRYVSLALTNNLIAGHTVGITNTAAMSSTIAGDHNLLWNGSDPIVGVDPILADPLLTSEYRPGSGSPAIDAGATIAWLTTDLEGNPRPQGAGYDIGAFEWIEPRQLYLPLVLRNAN